MSRRNKKDEKKVSYSISEPTVIEEKGKFNIENESTKFIIILLCIVAFIAILWLVDTLKNNKDAEEPEEKTVNINYSEVLVGNMLDQKYDKYVVYAYNKDSENDDATIKYLLTATEHYYTLNLDLANNLPAVAETSNFEGTIDQIKFKGLTLLIIENGKISKFYEGLVTQLTQNVFRNIHRVLGDEVDADSLGTDQSDDLLYLRHQRLGCVVEQQVRLVEEEDELRLVQVSHLRQLVVDGGQEPHQEGGIEPWVVVELIRREDVEHTLLGVVHSLRDEEILDLEFRKTEEEVAALLLQRQQVSLDGAYGYGRDVTVFRLELLGVLSDIVECGAEVLQVVQRHVPILADAEDSRQHALLRVGERHDAGE